MRLPIPSQDKNSWGEILNSWLRVAHNDDGTLTDATKDNITAGLAQEADLVSLTATVEDVDATAARVESRVFDVRDPQWAGGAVGNNTADDTAALQACADACEAALGTYFIPAHMTCKISSQLDLRYIRNINIEGRIKVSHTTGIGVLIGNSSSVVRDVRMFINEVSYSGAQTNIAIRAVGLKNGKITVNICPYLQLYANAADATMSSIAYTDWAFGKVDKHELYGETGVSWINENRFHGGRITVIAVSSVGDTYIHNHNKWYDSNLESAAITFSCGSSNLIQGARFEGTTPVITFGVNTWRNRIVQTWESSQTVIWPTATVTDSGFGNKVVMHSQEAAISVPVWRIDRASRMTNVSSPWIVPHATSRITPGFQKIKAPAAVEYLDTGIFPVASVTPGPLTEGGTILKALRFASDVSMWRIRVWVYDSTQTALDGTSTTYMFTGGGWAWQVAGYYQHGANVGENPANAKIVPAHSAVKYMRVVLLGNSAGGSFTYAELMAMIEAPHGTQFVDLIQRQMARPLYQVGTTPPTQSLLHKGEVIQTDTGTLKVTHRVDTTLSVAAAATNTTITVTSATGINTGDNIAILLDDDTTHFTTVNGAPAGSVVTLTVAVPGAAAIGKQVATQRWLHIT